MPPKKRKSKGRGRGKDSSEPTDFPAEDPRTGESYSGQARGRSHGSTESSVFQGARSQGPETRGSYSEQATGRDQYALESSVPPAARTSVTRGSYSEPATGRDQHALESSVPPTARASVTRGLYSEQATGRDQHALESSAVHGAPAAAHGAFSAPTKGRGRGSPRHGGAPSEHGGVTKTKEMKDLREPRYAAQAGKSRGEFPSGMQRATKASSSGEKSTPSTSYDALEKLSDLSLKQKPLVAQRKKPIGKDSSLEIVMAERPGIGTDGRKIALVANYLMIKFKDISVYHYDVDIFETVKGNKQGKSLLSQGPTAKEDAEKNVLYVERQQKRSIGKKMCREIISKMVKSKALQNYNPIYDGQKNIFTSQPLPFTKKTLITVELEMNSRKKSYVIGIQPVIKQDESNIISLKPLRELYTGHSSEIPQDVLLVFDTVMSHRELPLTQMQVRNSYFFLNEIPSYLGCGMEIRFGYNQSVRLAEVGPVLVVNLAAKAFHIAGPVIHFASDVINCDITKLTRLEKWQTFEIEKALKNLRVKVTHQKQPRKYIVKGISKMSAKELMLSIENKNKSVAQYFLEKYQYRLKYPTLPCLHMKTTQPTTFIPMETCEVIEGQVKSGKLSGDLTSKMIKQTAVPPRDRFEEIERYSQEINNISGKIMNSFGLFMDVTLMNVNGRIITAPALTYAGKKESSVARPDNRGVWRIEDGKQFYKVNRINAWILISFAQERFIGMDKLYRYAECLMNSSRKCGMSCGRPIDIKIFDGRTSTKEAILYAKRNHAEFAIFVLSRRDNSHSYEEVKFLADFKYGLVTQCMEDKTLNRINDQITTNVCLKINVKLGGINHIFLHKPRVFSRPVMVLGADVIHWMRGLGLPSIAAVVGSFEETASKYTLNCSIQKHDKNKLSQEIIKNMKDIIVEMLKTFENKSGCIPEKIIFFRDGVSEGQFLTVIEKEISAIQQATYELYQMYIPITFIVVQKRHQTRLRPKNPKDGAGKCGNVPPGTTVDTTITHPVFFDYFLCSHEGIQGTSKPAHYTVLHDDNGFNADELQQLSYFLCHTYVRCTRSVSIPAPVLYADLAAARAKSYADLHIRSDTLSSIDGSEDYQRSMPREVEEAIENMKSFESNMFYV